MQFKYLPEFEAENHTYGLLSLGQNRLKRLDANAFNGIHVRKIKMMGNHRKDMMVHVNAFKGLEDDLTSIAFKKNKIPSLPVGIFRGLRKLDKIELISCGKSCTLHSFRDCL